MANYVGETIRIKTSGTTPDGDELDDGNVSAANVTVYDADGEVVLDTTALAWLDGDGDEAGYWYYDWTTSSVEAGAYRFKARLVGIGFDTWEWGRIRLSANPF